MQKFHMNNFDQIVTDKKIPIRIAYLNADGTPNIISLWYEQIEGKIFCATQKSAKIVSYFQKYPKCGFEIAPDKPPYKGVRGYGSVKISEQKGQEVLEILMKKYLGTKESILSKYLKRNSKTEIAIEITPEKIIHYDYSKRMKDV